MGKIFLGKIYTGDNFDDFLPEMDVDLMNATVDEVRDARAKQKWLAKKEIQREKKHLKAFLRGKSSYTFHGHTFMVLSKTVKDEDQSTKSSNQTDSDGDTQ